MKQIKHSLALAAASILAGCSTTSMEPIKQEVNSVQAETNKASENLRTGIPLNRVEDTLIRRSSKVWVPVSKVELPLSPAATVALNREIAVNRRFSGLDELGAYITQMTGVPVSVASAALRASSEMMSAASVVGTSGPAPGAPMPPPMPMGVGGVPSPMGVGGVMTSPGTMNGSAAVTSFLYTGKVSGFLDLVAARYGVSWEWEGAGLHIFRTKSKTFRLAALPGDTSLASRVGTQSNNATGSSQGGQASGNSSSEMRAGVEFTGLSVWSGIERSINTMLSPAGKLVVTAATGTITVEDTPMVLARVGHFIEEQNKALSRQVVINVRVLAVDVSESEQYGINWDMVYENLNSRFGVSLAAAANPVTGGSSLALQVLSGSMFEGSSAMIEALSKQGRVSQVTSASLVTINNQPAPIQVGRQTAFLASSTTTIGTGGAGNTVTLQPGQVTTGFSMNMLPHILDSNRLLLQYSGDISTLTNLSTVTSGDSSIQTPEIDTRNFLQRTFLNSGETLVVTGFEQFALNGDTQGIGSAENLALGGRVNTKNSRTVLVVLIQPVVTGGL